MKPPPSLTIAGKKIGAGSPCFVVAEISGNHHQRFDEAKELVRQAKIAGADAVKLQTYTADTLTIDSDRPDFRVTGKDNPDEWKGQTLYQLYQQAYTPWDWQPSLKKLADEVGIPLFSSAFDDSSVAFLEKMDIPCYKVASYELTHFPLLRTIAATGRPVICSIGFANLNEVTEAVETLRSAGCQEIALLHCVTSYTDHPEPSDAHLATIMDLRNKFQVVTGFSDNNAGIDIPIAACYAGASIIEKHFILDHASGGPDAKFSLDPAEFKTMVARIRTFEAMVGMPHYGPSNAAEEYNQRFRRSIYVVAPIRRGEPLTEKNIRVIRPAFGLPSRYWLKVLGRTAKKDLERGDPLRVEDVEMI